MKVTLYEDQLLIYRGTATVQENNIVMSDLSQTDTVLAQCAQITYCNTWRDD